MPKLDPAKRDASLPSVEGLDDEAAAKAIAAAEKKSAAAEKSSAKSSESASDDK